MDATPTPPRIVLYDGVCGLCDRLVQFLVAKDRERLLRYAPLQGDTAARLRAQHAAIPQDLDTMVFVDEGQVYLRSRAAARIARYLPWPWRAGAAVRFVPRVVADWAYGLVARSRYRIFGKVEACGLPTPEERRLLLP
jgi:predicted DCC family thiol-disulfide oxidoreductase YuxK